MECHHEALRRIEVAELDARRARVALRVELQGRHLFLANPRHADLEHDVRGLARRQAGKLVTGHLVGAEPHGADLKGHRRPRLVEEMHPPDRILEDQGDLIDGEQADHERHEDHHDTLEQGQAQVLQMLKERFARSARGAFRSHCFQRIGHGQSWSERHCAKDGILRMIRGTVPAMTRRGARHATQRMSPAPSCQSFLHPERCSGRGRFHDLSGAP